METKTMNAIFSENLRNRLYLKRMTQGELAKKLGVSEASVSKWCLGDAMPRPKKIERNVPTWQHRSRRIQNEICRTSAEISRNPKKPSLKTKIFASNWKDLYAELDDVHRRSFWRKLITQIVITVETKVVEVIY